MRPNVLPTLTHDRDPAGAGGPSTRAARLACRRGFTLLEAVVAITVLGVIGASVLPIVAGVSDNLRAASDVRRAGEHAGFAMERALRMLRDCPPGATAGTLDLLKGEVSLIEYADGRKLEFAGGELLYNGEVLCPNVEDFAIAYIGDDGVTDVGGSPTTAGRFEVLLVVGGLELRGAAFPRCRVVSP
jgi:prepilin-type N-terminal cleavage/methylation domain-containing protein